MSTIDNDLLCRIERDETLGWAWNKREYANSLLAPITVCNETTGHVPVTMKPATYRAIRRKLLGEAVADRIENESLSSPLSDD